MSTIIREFPVDADVDRAWAALADVAKVNQLITFLGPVTLDGDVRRVDMGSYGMIEELIVNVDDERRRVAYSVRQGPWALTHHHSSMQVLAPEYGATGSRFVWIIDLKPDTLTEEFAAGVDGAVAAIKQSLAG